MNKMTQLTKLLQKIVTCDEEGLTIDEKLSEEVKQAIDFLQSYKAIDLVSLVDLLDNYKKSYPGANNVIGKILLDIPYTYKYPALDSSEGDSSDNRIEDALETLYSTLARTILVLNQTVPIIKKKEKQIEESLKMIKNVGEIYSKNSEKIFKKDQD